MGRTPDRFAGVRVGQDLPAVHLHGHWNQPFPITNSGIAPPGGGIAAVGRQANQLDVFWIDNWGEVGTTWWNASVNNDQWNQAFPITDPNVAPSGAWVAAVARTTDHLDVFWVDNWGEVGSNWWDQFANNGLWNQPFRISDPNIARPGAAITAVARTPNHLDVFWVDNWGEVGTNWWDGSVNNGSWNQPFRITDPNTL